MTFTVDVLFTCTMYWTPGQARIRTVCKVQQINSFHGYHICLPTCFFGDVVGLLPESYTLVERNSFVSCSYLTELNFWSSMYKVLSPLIVLKPQDLN